MSLFWKRLGIVFSVALNIGFIGMAIFMVCQHGTSEQRHERFSRELVAMVQQLQLPEEKEKIVLKKIEGFDLFINKHKQNIRQAQSGILLCLAENGPLDRAKLQQHCALADKLVQKRDRAFEAHAIELRALLGDAKGAEFFGLLLEHLQSTCHAPD